MWFTYCRCLRKHLKCHFLEIELNNWLLDILQQSIKVSVASHIAVSVEELIDLLFTRCWLLPMLSITLYRHPCHTWKVELFWQRRMWLIKLRVFRVRRTSLMRDNIVKQCIIPELRFTERSTTIIGSQGGVQLLQCITDYKGVVSSQTDGEEPVGFALVPERSKNSARMTRTEQFWSFVPKFFKRCCVRS
jgi:hypothetical protein